MAFPVPDLKFNNLEDGDISTPGNKTLLRCCSTYDPDAPCTLREEHSTFTNTLTDQLFPEPITDTYIDPNDLPLFDIILPDPDEAK